MFSRCIVSISLNLSGVREGFSGERSARRRWHEEGKGRLDWGKGSLSWEKENWEFTACNGGR